MEAAANAMLARHRENDALAVEPTLAEKDVRQIERLDREAAQMRQWLNDHPADRKGVIQGYTGVAAVDDKHQIIVEAQAHRSSAGKRAAANGGKAHD
jgi:hypothetical protein